MFTIRAFEASSWHGLWHETPYDQGMAESRKPRRRSRGNVEKLKNGSLRVRVYAGVDPVTKRTRYLRRHGQEVALRGLPIRHT